MRLSMLALLLTACEGTYDRPASTPPTDAPAAQFSDTTRAPMGGVGTEQADMDGATSPRLVRTASMYVAIGEYGPFEDALTGWLAAGGGRIAQVERSANAGQVGDATLVVRVPADKLDALTTWLEERVSVEHLSVHTADVTAEWVDVDARIANGRRAEIRLQELLAERTGDLGDVLAVERELSRVRGEIEAAEGQMRVLSDRVNEATLTLGVRVAAPYTPAAAPGLVERMSQATVASVGVMGEVGAGLLVALAAASPWIVVMAAVFGVLVAGLRRVLRPAGA